VNIQTFNEQLNEAQAVNHQNIQSIVDPNQIQE